MRKQLLTLLALAAITSQGAAQQPGQDKEPSAGMMSGMSKGSSDSAGGGMQMMGGMGEGGGMMAMPGHDVMQQAMRLAPGRILKNGEALELTGDQVERIEALVESDSDGRAASMKSAMAAQQELKDLFEADSPDIAAVRAAAEKALTMHAGMHAQRIAAAAAVRSILSAEQLEQAMLLHGGMMGNRGGMMGNKGSDTTVPGGDGAPASAHEQHHPSDSGDGS